MRPHIASPACLRLLLGACAGLGAGLVTPVDARDPAAPYLGMTEAEIMACAGKPHARYRSGPEAETLTYRYSGAGPVAAEPKKSDQEKKEKKKKKSIADIFGDKTDKPKNKDWTCTASLVFEQGRLVRVNFAHKDVRSPYAWQSEKDPKKQEAMRKEEIPTCTFSLPNCHR
jgi:hypothetical protein